MSLTHFSNIWNFFIVNVPSGARKGVSVFFFFFLRFRVKICGDFQATIDSINRKAVGPKLELGMNRLKSRPQHFLIRSEDPQNGMATRLRFYRVTREIGHTCSPWSVRPTNLGVQPLQRHCACAVRQCAPPPRSRPEFKDNPLPSLLRGADCRNFDRISTLFRALRNWHLGVPIRMQGITVRTVRSDCSGFCLPLEPPSPLFLPVRARFIVIVNINFQIRGAERLALPLIYGLADRTSSAHSGSSQ